MPTPLRLPKNPQARQRIAKAVASLMKLSPAKRRELIEDEKIRRTGKQ